ncbi:MAG: CPBP family intramembrane metalloprotease [Polyangiaceae bacterium]|nr:CPBP family intramembrane metalloprotease [Polyangiaceae bacterium]MCW5789513.1 CPBP family intramembrane metalloprotease [Polyangiaceae bacterium]
MHRWGRYVAAYVGLAALAVGIGWGWLGYAMWTLPDPWLALGAPHAVSAGAGAGLAAVVIGLTRLLVPRLAWARQLHRDLRPVARGLGPLGVVALAVFSALGEELLFRGLAQPLVGVWLQALIFGVIHQGPGKSRWVWVAWATVMGLLLGLLFQLTGSLVGPVVAHALINAVNLTYLKHHDPDPKPSRLGGLLRQR